MTMIALRYDLRLPPFATHSHADAYAACLDQCAWAEATGAADMVVLSEHHGVEDGFMSSPVTLAAAIAGRTKRLRINIAAALLPLHDPVRLAEQMAVVDLVSPGRLSLVAGLGYRQEEFDMAAVDRTQRGKLLDEYVGVLRHAWSGEAFEWRGRTVRVTPTPAQAPMILIGGSTPIAARRAARLRCGFFPAIGDRALVDVYNAECAKYGFTGFASLPGGPGFVHVSDDPARDWPVIAPHALYDAQSYHSWQTSDQRSQVHTDAQTLDELQRSGVYKVVTPDECVALARSVGTLVLHPLMGGMPPALGWRGLELFASDVLPQLRAAA